MDRDRAFAPFVLEGPTVLSGAEFHHINAIDPSDPTAPKLSQFADACSAQGSEPRKPTPGRVPFLLGERQQPPNLIVTVGQHACARALAGRSDFDPDHRIVGEELP